MSIAGDRPVAVVTGASSGIGRQSAVRLARDGFAVVVGYRSNEAGARATIDEIVTAGGSAEPWQVDIAEATHTEAGVAELFERHRRLDVWANLAGADILTGPGAGRSDIEKLDALLAVDLRGTMVISWAVAERFRARGGGAIINMSWDLALHGMAGRNPEMFAAVKAGVTGFTRALARSYAPEVRVNEVAPGWIETRFAAEDMAPDYYRRVVESTPLSRFGRPEDVAGAVAYLASPEAGFITGQTLKVNGGLSS